MIKIKIVFAYVFDTIFKVFCARILSIYLILTKPVFWYWCYINLKENRIMWFVAQRGMATIKSDLRRYKKWWCFYRKLTIEIFKKENVTQNYFVMLISLCLRKTRVRISPVHRVGTPMMLMLDHACHRNTNQNELSLAIPKTLTMKMYWWVQIKGIFYVPSLLKWLFAIH